MAWQAVAGKVAQAVAPAATTGLFGWIGAKRARKFSEDAATTAYQRDVEMWNKANAYNAPQAQMERLKAAGLNPNMIYGSGSSAATGQTSTSMPKHQNYEQPTYTFNPQNMLGMLSQFMDIKGKKLSNDAQAINNEYLQEKLYLANKNLGITFRKGDIDLGRTVEGFEKSPYFRKSQAQVKGMEHSNVLKKIQTDFYKTIPKEYQWIAPLLLRLIK